MATDGYPQRKENKPLIQRSLNSLERLIFLKLVLKRTSAVLFYPNTATLNGKRWLNPGYDFISPMVVSFHVEASGLAILYETKFGHNTITDLLHLSV